MKILPVLLAVSLVLGGAALAKNANEPVVLADDIYNRVIRVTSATDGILNPSDLIGGGGGSGQSGLGDGTNPGNGSDNNESDNEGTDNPNNSPD